MVAALGQPSHQQCSDTPQPHGNQSNNHTMPQGYASLEGLGGQVAYPGGQMEYSGGKIQSGNLWHLSD